MGNRSSQNQKLKTATTTNGSANKIGPHPEKVKKRLNRLNEGSGSRPNSAGSSSSRAENLRRRLNRMSSTAERLFHDEVDAVRDHAEVIADIPYQQYEYPFENLVFEGGGAKGQVYIGCLEVRSRNLMTHDNMITKLITGRPQAFYQHSFHTESF